jgi:hypothetical protein
MESVVVGVFFWEKVGEERSGDDSVQIVEGGLNDLVA